MCSRGLVADDDARRVEIVVEGFAFAEKFGRKNDVVVVILLA